MKVTYQSTNLRYFTAWIWILTMLKPTTSENVTSSAVKITTTRPTISPTTSEKTSPPIQSNTTVSTLTVSLPSTHSEPLTTEAPENASGSISMGLAVGLGAGLPLALLIIIVIALCCYRSRKKKHGINKMVPFNPMKKLRQVTKKHSKSVTITDDTAQDNPGLEHDGDQKYENISTTAVIPSLNQDPISKSPKLDEHSSTLYINVPKNLPEQHHRSPVPVQKKKQAIPVPHKTPSSNTKDPNYYNLSSVQESIPKDTAGHIQRFPSVDQDVYDPVEVSNWTEPHQEHGGIYQNVTETENSQNRQTSEQYYALKTDQISHVPGVYTDLIA